MVIRCKGAHILYMHICMVIQCRVFCTLVLSLLQAAFFYELKIAYVSSQCKDILQLMIEASGEDEEEEGDSDDELKEDGPPPPVECPAHRTTNAPKGVMTDAEVIENSMLFMFAGKDTTAIALSYATYELALNPDIQEKLQSEIDAYFEEKPVS